ncbi:succinate dehydrogenase/fumarate reductase iron-sulfur subunit [Nocardioides dokdonensis FR1436]|uniref:Succinate dehydrogenase/fumarate reductase iron-sulfur subunit n=1 Tax=Nocardioides dokdonensis FR1436 TaxID=1300347 RepID=A0A1A9GGM1_9ACTN|nr:(Fe-S)-binding protein [Nocardioides dokdonensis]ANH37428.1 succinate dehydrogenase/fumarate reductase iron-sulfur subunit [Nocardioides dokdonensis FR1436]
MQTFAIVVSLAFTAVAVVMTTRAVRAILATVRVGTPLSRTDEPVRRTVTLLKESLLHTRMLQWRWIGVMHWFIYAAFIVLSAAVATGFVQLFDPHFQLWIIGHFFLYEWISEGLGLLGTIGIVFLAVHRQLNHPRSQGRKSRFFGSTQWQAYFVEAFVLIESAAILFIRGAEYNLGLAEGQDISRFNFPISSFFGDALFATGADNVETLENTIIFIAMIKVVLAMTWLMVISSNLTMGVAWHRFTAWFNIWFKRESTGRDTDGATTALGAVKPLTNQGKRVSLDDIDDLDEDAALGVGAIEDFSWKGILDFTTCTECGRCQSQCPAWNTEKPLSPKLLITALRDHAYAKAPYLQAAEGDRAALLEGDTALATEVERPLVGETGDDWFYMPDSGVAVIDPEVLWNCTNCGACVQQCPVDIEHVDHIIDMRRHQVLVESNFPAELNGLFKGLENKGNPWNMSPSARMDWAKGLDFDVKVVGEDIESLDEVEWLFWVGCAGAYEDRAKKTTRAVAELLHMADVSFGVLGNGETCTGDPARRAGNEFVFQGLAMQNVETLTEHKVKKVVSTCAHCFNTLKNEYKEFGIELEVTHHTQLLNRLVREGKLTPVQDGAGAHKRSITYHDPCFIGRHNGVYSPPRELLQVLPGAEVVEMERNSERSFCCGAGGARMWMEENTGERINVNRTTEAIGTGADQIAVGCPFCRVMLSDGLTMKQSKGEAREEVEVLDVAQMLLASVKGEMATKAAPGSSAAAAPAAKAAAPAAKTADKDSGKESGKDEATKAEPEAGDATITEDTVVETQDAGPAAKASGGSSLFDSPDAAAADDKPAAATSGGSLFDTPDTAAADKPAAEEAKAAKPESSGGSLFDLGGDAPAAPAKADPKAETAPKAEPAEAKTETAPAAKAETTDLSGGGSLFDLGGDAPAAPAKADPKAEAAPKAEPAEPKAEAAPAAKAETTDLSGGGSLFDIPAAEPVAKAPAEPKAEAAPKAEAPAEPKVEAKTEAAPAAKSQSTDLSGGGSLFDIAAPEPSAPSTSSTPAAEPEPAVETEPEPEPEAKATPEPAPEPTPEPAATTATPAAASSGSAVTPKTDVDVNGLGSLFDIEAPEATTVERPAAAPAPEPEAAAPAPEPEAAAPVEEPEKATAPTSASTSDDVSPGAALSAAATQAAGTAEETPEPPEAEVVAEEPAVEEPATEAPAAEEPAAEEPAEPAPKPASSGAAHTPKTDADIEGTSSLFDL